MYFRKCTKYFSFARDELMSVRAIRGFYISRSDPNLTRFSLTDKFENPGE